jgi:NifU-like protein involved in Fe-S cluster formation
MNPYGETIQEHFRHPRNYGSLDAPDIRHEEVNPASSLLTEMIAGLPVEAEIHPARLKCAPLPLEGLRSGVATWQKSGGCNELQRHGDDQRAARKGLAIPD